MIDFWRSAQSEDSAGNDVDAGRVIALWGGAAVVFNMVVPLNIFVFVRVLQTGEFEGLIYAGAVAALATALSTLLAGTGAYILMKGKGEGQPT